MADSSPSMLPGETHNPLQEAAEADAPPCRCQKTRRRSSRLIFKERSLSNSRAIQDGPLGFFQILPVEMVYNILYELAIVDLSVLTIVSKAVRGLVECFMDSKRGEDRLLLRVSLHKPASQDHAGLMQHFRRLGVLQKRATCLYTTRDRLRIIEQFIQKMDLMSCFGCSNQCLALTCYGRFLHTVIAGWDEMECLRVYVLVNTHVQRRLNQVLHSTHDSAVWMEMGDAESNTPASTVVLAELGSAIKTLHNYGREWTEDDIIGVIEEVTAIPESWTGENLARLLTLCGESVCVQLLGSKAINGRLDELAEIIVHLAKEDLYYMLSSVPLSPILTLPLPPGEDTDPTDLYYMLEAQSAFHTELMKEAFADLLSS
ncbi:PREDICTED: F-box only protein 47-like [Branchiostoma belcheri]|uniref:F-box only protein 47-like n=1 Tax=Branchiostoma belcheri TaxID=7741 RepID=A0A6P4ZSI5_BRABE|nr:PREDICTED: F-box only protein 47-like [Branchiostoma belcheri]